MKQCTYCGEEVLEKAIKCKHCGSFFEQDKKEEIREESKKKILEEYSQNYTEERKKTRKNRLLFYLIILAIVIAISLIQYLSYTPNRFHPEFSIHNSSFGSLLPLFIIFVIVIEFIIVPKNHRKRKNEFDEEMISKINKIDKI